MRLGITHCGTTAWTSVSSVACFGSNSLGSAGIALGERTSVIHGNGHSHSLSATTSGILGTYFFAFTYDAPLVSYLPIPNIAVSSYKNIMLHGENFGMLDSTPTLGFGYGITGNDISLTHCLTTSWTTGTAVRCLGAVGFGYSHTTSFTIAVTVGTKSHIFTYDVPVVTFSALNHPLTRGGSMTVAGFNFGKIDTTVTVQISTTICSTTAWSTATRVMCIPNFGSFPRGTLHSIVLTVSQRVSTRCAVLQRCNDVAWLRLVA